MHRAWLELFTYPAHDVAGDGKALGTGTLGEPTTLYGGIDGHTDSSSILHLNGSLRDGGVPKIHESRRAGD